MVVEVALICGLNVYDVLDLDMRSLDSLAESVFRIKYLEKTEDAWTMMLAAQGKSEDMDKWVKRWRPAIGRKGTQEQNDVKKFMSDFGKGF